MLYEILRIKRILKKYYPNTDGNGNDFYFTSSILTFPAGDNSTLCISPSVLADMILEINETYLLNLSTTDEDVILKPISTTVTIVNDDGKLQKILFYSDSDYGFIVNSPVVSLKFSQPSQSIGEGDGHVEVCVILRGQTERDITVTVSTMSGTASGMC